MRNLRQGDCFISTSGGQARGRRQFALNARSRPPDASSTKQRPCGLRDCPPFKTFESLRRCVYTHHLHTNAILNTTVYTLEPLHCKQALVFITRTTPPSLTSLPLQTRTPSLPGETSPAQGEDVRLQARYVSSVHISNTFKSLEAIGSTANELATEQRRDRLRDTSRHALY